jgi:dTDP-4-dehydrorhamnose 3,5-epimerase
MEELPIAGLVKIVPKRFSDTRGYFVEMWSQRALRTIGITEPFVQDNQSLSHRRGTLRGLHCQREPVAQAKLIRVHQGAIFDVAVDLRPGSPTRGQWCGLRLDAAAGEQLFIPRGFAHGFVSLEPETLVGYSVDAPYSPEHEMGIRWDDPDLAIDWPVASAEVAMSERDARLPYLKQIYSEMDE